ncbi:MAG: VCBS repeat-containing protein, partial [Sedimentisphaerales bacterium]|nr:VCBS repeat-containing protein [Sedimentisphaerales bacterium]
DKNSEIAVLSVKEKVIGISKYKDDRLSFPKPIELVGEPLAMELADIDGDGNSDCVYISKNDKDARYLRILYNLAAATEQKTAFVPSSGRGEDKGQRTENLSSVIRHPNTVLELTKLTANPDALKVLDVDQDGLQDVLIFVSYELPILVRQVRKPVPSEAEGMEFEIVDSPKMQASLIKDARLNSIAIANVDGKPGDELLLAQKNFARSLVFAEGQSWNVIDQYNAKSTENQISAVAAFDIYGRGTETKHEILLLDGLKGYLQILRAGDDKTYRFEKELDVGRWDNAAHLKMLFASLTGSGNKNILLFDGSKLALITPPTESNMQTHLVQQFSYETKIKDGLYGNLTAGDINSDGRTDIIMVEYNRNHIEILSLDNDIKPVPAMRFKIFEQKSYRDSKLISEFGVEPRDLSVTDVTGDGKNDLVTAIHDRIIIYPQD